MRLREGKRRITSSSDTFFCLMYYSSAACRVPTWRYHFIHEDFQQNPTPNLQLLVNQGAYLYSFILVLENCQLEWPFLPYANVPLIIGHHSEFFARELRESTCLTFMDGLLGVKEKLGGMRTSLSHWFCCFLGEKIDPASSITICYGK